MSKGRLTSSFISFTTSGREVTIEKRLHRCSSDRNEGMNWSHQNGDDLGLRTLALPSLTWLSLTIMVSRLWTWNMPEPQNRAEWKYMKIHCGSLWIPWKSRGSRAPGVKNHTSNTEYLERHFETFWAILSWPKSQFTANSLKLIWASLS